MLSFIPYSESIIANLLHNLILYHVVIMYKTTDFMYMKKIYTSNDSEPEQRKCIRTCKQFIKNETK